MLMDGNELKLRTTLCLLFLIEFMRRKFPTFQRKFLWTIWRCLHFSCAILRPAIFYFANSWRNLFLFKWWQKGIFLNLPPEAVEVEVDSNVMDHPIGVRYFYYLDVFSATHGPLDNHILKLLVEESAKKCRCKFRRWNLTQNQLSYYQKWSTRLLKIFQFHGRYFRGSYWFLSENILSSLN